MKAIAIGGLVSIAAGGWVTTVSHAAADISLNLRGVYVDEIGCGRMRGQPDALDGGVVLSNREFGGREWRCRFVWAYSIDGHNEGFSASRVWSVIEFCASEGEAHSRLLSVEEDRGTVIIREGQKQPIELRRCK